MRSPAGLGSPASFARKHAAATAIDALAAARPASCKLGEVGRQARVVELASGEPGVQPPERAGVGAACVRADGGLDPAARGLRRAADSGFCGVDPGGRIIHVKGTDR